MEFVGRRFEKQFKGSGGVKGVVNSYDQSSGLLKVLYDDGNIEELELSEVSLLLMGEISLDAQSGSDGSCKRQKIDGPMQNPEPGKNSVTLNGGSRKEDGECSDMDAEVVLLMECGANEPLKENPFSMNSSDGCLGLNNGLDLSAVLDAKNGSLDLTLDAGSDDKGNKSEDGGVSAMEVEGQECCLNVNLDMEKERNDLEETQKETDAGFEKDQIDASNNGIAPNHVLRSNKRKKETPFMSNSSPGSVLRRSSRLRSTTISATNHVSILADSEVPQTPVLNSVKESIVGTPEFSDHKESEDCGDVGGGVLSKLQLPPSSKKFNLDGIPVFDLFSIYAFLRSFSTILFLSPFEFEGFFSSLKLKVPNQLIDSIHVSLLQTLRKHLKVLSGENSISASNCLRSLNWDMLDLITWPIFLVEYFLLHGSALNLSFDIHELKYLCENDYYTLPDRVKIEILRYLCDDAIESENIIFEINKRAMLIDSNVDSECYIKPELSSRKRKTDVSINSYVCEEIEEDGNMDECCLCKMDGSLICCDSCPAAYHSKCVGIASSDLPDGDWYCHECLMDKNNPEAKLGKTIRGAEILGVDCDARIYYCCCGYLLVLDQCGGEPTYHYYCPNDVILVLHSLKTLQSEHNEIMHAIAREWKISIASVGSKIQDQENMDNCIDLKEQMPVIEATDIFMKMENTLNSGEALQTVHAVAFQDSGADGQAILNTSNGRGEIQSIDSNHKLNLIDGRNGDRLQELETGYLNFYSFALRASSVVEELATQKSLDKTGEASLKSKKNAISAQLKAISTKFNKFYWPNIPNLSIDVRKEKCGWCFSCRSPDYGGDCFSNLNNSGPSMENFTSRAIGLSSQQFVAKGHLADVACYILFMEDRLLGLLLGPWLNPDYSNLWRQSLMKAAKVADLKHLLLSLELNLNRRALSAEWLKQVDIVPTQGSACHFVINTTQVSLKHGFVRKRGRPSLMETSVSSNTSGGLYLLWRRGGKVSQHLFNWKVLPHSMASKAARRASCTMIPGLSYSDGPEFLKRSKRIAWQAAIESSRSVPQLALQVRELDVNIRWDEIDNTCVLSKGLHLRKSTRQPFNKVIVRRKLIEGNVTKYMLDFGKRKFIPEIVSSHGVIFEESSDKKKYWLEESYVPLHLLKNFEQKKITRKSNNITSRECLMFDGIRKPQRKEIFSYLFTKAEKAEGQKCDECSEFVQIREAVSCQQCKGFFHKIHARISDGTKDAINGTFICQKCSKNMKPGKTTEQKQARKGKKDLGLAKGLKSPPRVRKETSKKKNSVKKNVVSAPAQCSTMVEALAVETQLTWGRKRERSIRSSGKRMPKKKENSAWKRKRTCIPRVYWLNGVQLSEILNDERIVNFRSKKLIIPSDPASVMGKPKCGLCREPKFTSALNYIACETCKDWFHGDAFGLNEDKIGKVIRFKCHKCLKSKRTPVCPHHPDEMTKTV